MLSTSMAKLCDETLAARFRLLDLADLDPRSIATFSKPNRTPESGLSLAWPCGHKFASVFPLSARCTRRKE